MKKILSLMILLNVFVASAETLKLEKGSAKYTVSHTIKKVTGESKKLHGVIKCEKETCEFLMAIPVKSFESSDSNRDLNMLTIIEAGTYPLTTGKGSFPKENLGKEKWSMQLEIDFHGKKKVYQANIQKTEMKIHANLILDLEAHQIDRPSLFTVKIDNDVPMDFDLNWVEDK